MPAQLMALTGGPNILLDKPILLLGRHPECDIQIDSRKISRRHCCIAQVNDYYLVRDLGSTNGVRINGNRVIEGRLNQGDELTIGSHRYRMTLPDEPAPPREARVRQGQRPKTDPDDLLESCDEPIALSEGGSEAAPVSPVPRRPARSDPSPPLPEHIDLRSTNDSYPEISGPSSVHPAS